MSLVNAIFEDLESLDWDKFEKSLLSPGEVFFVPRKGAKEIRLLKVGDLIDNVFLGKYEHIKDKLFIRKMKDDQNFLIKDFIGDAIHHNRKERLERKESFIKSFFNEIWLESDQENFELYIYTCFNTFSNFERSILFEIEEGNQLLFRRAMVIGAMGIFFAHCMDCNDFFFMKELYNSLFCLDVGLLYPKANYHVIEALKHERLEPGKGLEYLKKVKVSSETIAQYMEHSEQSIKVIEETWDLTFSDDKIYNIVKLHHENPDGYGFPKNINSKQMFHWEEIAFFLDQWIPFEKDCMDIIEIQNQFYRQENKSICYQYFLKWQELIENNIAG